MTGGGARLILVGRVLGAQGLDGAVKIRSFAETLATFAAGRRLRVVAPGGATREIVSAGARLQGRSVRLALEGVADRSQAEALIGAELYVDRDDLPEPEPGVYYWSDLIGIEVFAVGGARLGRIASILPTGANDVYVVRGPEGRELLIPALASVIAAVDLAAGRMEVDLPEGLEWQ